MRKYYADAFETWDRWAAANTTGDANTRRRAHVFVVTNLPHATGNERKIMFRGRFERNRNDVDVVVLN